VPFQTHDTGHGGEYRVGVLGWVRGCCCGEGDLGEAKGIAGAFIEGVEHRVVSRHRGYDKRRRQHL
jgi:hypothetical protein